MPIDINSDTLESAKSKLKAKEDSLIQIEEMLGFGSWEVNLKTHQTYWSDHIYALYGVDKDSVTPTLELFYSFVVPEDLQGVQDALHRAITTKEVVMHECKIKNSRHEISNIIVNGKVIFDRDGIAEKIIGVTRDITKEVQLQKHSEELSELIEFSSNEIYIINIENSQYLYANRGASNATGYTLEEFLGKDIYDLNPYLTKENANKLSHTLQSQNNILNRTIHRRKDGSEYHVQSYIHTYTYHGQDAFVIFDVDISQLIETEELLKEQSKKLSHLAHHDALTNLPNRAFFQERLKQCISSAKRNTTQFALLFIDLDQFKQINDSLGHHIGDEVLKEAANRIKTSLRSEDTLARLGGDEFTIIIKDITDFQNASSVAQKILNMIKEPIQVDKHTLYISTSIGISIYPKDSKNQHDLVKFADAAMYKAKEEGRNNYQFYSSNMTALAFERVVMESSLRIAIKENQFIVYYQPQYDALTNTLSGMEALIRWKHPTVGLVPPSKFIPIAEESGLIIEIDRLVMKQAMADFSQWYSDGLNPGILALNLAMKQLNSENFIPTLMNTMNRFNFKAKWLELEVTEGEIMKNPENSIEKLNQIHACGIELAIDDFGTGYSSLSYLKKLPLDKLKIDQSFVKDVLVDEDDAAITKAIISLGQTLNMKLIAEGVEEEEQKSFLLAHGCNLIQGYFYARPMPANKITELLQKK